MKIAILGSGVVGAAIAYELSGVEGLEVSLFDRNTPASGSTGAALGVLMGIISGKMKGRSWRLREASMRRFDSLITELEDLTGETIPYNRQGIIMLRFAGDDLTRWEKRIAQRQQQGWDLELWDLEKLREYCPQVQNERVIGAIYSPRDRQVHPTILTQALVTAAQQRGVSCEFGVKVENVLSTNKDASRHCQQLVTTAGDFEIDSLIISAGLGSTPLTTSLNQPLDIRPVLGQALQLKLNAPLGNPEFQPVITGEDVHIVPLENGEYWIGATVEFPNEVGEVMANETLLEAVKESAIAFCPDLAPANILRTWSGKRPRPEGQPAPIIRPLTGYDNVLLATGHYRNGVLLAPATAQIIRDEILNS